jgi:hypothetical protein
LFFICFKPLILCHVFQANIAEEVCNTDLLIYCLHNFSSILLTLHITWQLSRELSSSSGVGEGTGADEDALSSMGGDVDAGEEAHSGGTLVSVIISPR